MAPALPAAFPLPGRRFRPVLAAGGLALLGLVAAGCSSVGDEDEDPPAELVSITDTLKVDEVWSASVGGTSEQLRLGLTPATDGSRIFAAAHDGRVSAFEAARGKEIWSTKTGLELSGGPATDGRVVVVGSSDGDLVALGADDGEERWRRTVSSEVLAAPVMSGSLVIVQTVDGKLTAYQLTDGAQAWMVQENVPRLSLRGVATPALVKNAVVCGFANGRIIAYEVGDGSSLWETLLDPPRGRNEIERLADVDSQVKSTGDDLYAVGYQGRLAGLAVESGQVLWSQDISSYAGLDADIGNVYVTAATGELYAFDRGSGTQLWRNDSLHNRDVTAPAFYKGSIVVGDFEGYVHWFDAASGEPQARDQADSYRISGQPLVVNDMVYVQTDGGDLVAYRTKPL